MPDYFADLDRSDPFTRQWINVAALPCPSCAATHDALYVEHDNPLDPYPSLIACESCGFPLFVNDEWAPETQDDAVLTYDADLWLGIDVSLSSPLKPNP